MRGAIALLAVLYGARGEYPCAKEGVTNCSAVTYDDPFARGDKPKTTFTDEAYTDDFFCLPQKWRYKPGGFDETLFSTISPRHLGRGFIFERNKWESHDIMTEIARILMVERLGYPVKLQAEGSTGALYERLADGDFDFNMEVWTNVRQKIDDYDKYLDDPAREKKYRSLEDLGSIGYDGRGPPGH